MSAEQQNYKINAAAPGAAFFKSRLPLARTADEKNTFQDRRQKAGFLSGEFNKNPDAYIVKKIFCGENSRKISPIAP